VTPVRPPAVRVPTSGQAAVRRPTGSQSAARLPTGSQSAVRSATLPQGAPGVPRGGGNGWIVALAVLGLGAFVWASGCLRRKSNTAVPVAPVQSGEMADPGAGIVAAPAGRPLPSRVWVTDPAVVHGKAPPTPVDLSSPPAPRGDPLRGLPEPLGTRKGPGPEPAWRVRARNY
jgi:hypothetical protein